MKKTLVGIGVVAGIILLLFVAVKIHFSRARAKGRPFALEQIQLAEARLAETYGDLEREHPNWRKLDMSADSLLKVRYEAAMSELAGYRILVKVYDDLLDPDYIAPANIREILLSIDGLQPGREPEQQE